MRKYYMSKSVEDDIDENFDEMDAYGNLSSINLNDESFEEQNEGMINAPISETSKYVYSQMESMTLLNTVFELLKIEPITDM